MDGFVLLASGSGLLAIGAMVHKIAQRKEAQAKLIQDTPARKVRCYQYRALDRGSAIFSFYVKRLTVFETLTPSYHLGLSSNRSIMFTELMISEERRH